MNSKEIDAFVTNNNLEIKKLYEANRGMFLQFGKKYNLSTEALADIYQDAFVLLRRQALQGKLYEVKSSLRTYLFGIGKHLIYDELKRQKRFTSYIEHPEAPETIPIIEVAATTSLTLEQQVLQLHFEQLGKKCQEMLTMFYYRGLTISDIVSITAYESENVVRSQKSRCLKSLKDAIKSTPDE